MKTAIVKKNRDYLNANDLAQKIQDRLDDLHQGKQSLEKVGICGQAPRDYQGFAAFLIQAEIDSISLNPDSAIAVKSALPRRRRASRRPRWMRLTGWP